MMKLSSLRRSNQCTPAPLTAVEEKKQFISCYFNLIGEFSVNGIFYHILWMANRDVRSGLDEEAKETWKQLLFVSLVAEDSHYLFVFL